MKKSKHCDLTACFLCQRSLPEWKAAIQSHRKDWQFKKGESIFQEGDPVQGIYFVTSGIVKVHKKWGTEKEVILRFARTGEIFGHRGLGPDALYPAVAPIYPISATAIEPATACFVDLAFFQASLKVNQELIYGLLLFFAGELQESERKMRNLAHMPVKGRLAGALLSLQDKFGQTTDGFIGITLSRQDIASFVGATYETVFRTINELSDEHLIQTDGKHIRILDPDGLHNYSKQ